MSDTKGKSSLTCLLAIAEAEASKLEAENDELRIDVDLMNCQLRARGEERDDLQAENAKLRELLRDTLVDTEQYCDKHGIEYEGGADAWSKANADIDRRLCELGIVVDA